MASKITIKRSVTAAPPAGLSFGEMAFVQGSGVTANQLYVGISGGNPVWVGAKIGTTGTWTDDAAKTSLATQHAIEQRIAAKIEANTAGVATFNGATGAVTGVASFNGLTGAVSGVTTSVANTFTVLQTFSAGISTSGGTFGTPTQLVGTNITGTASGLTAGRVTTNANLTGAIISTGNATSLGSFTAQQLSDALSVETKTGATANSKLVFDTSPSLVNPTLGTALATTINKVTITAPATGSTITITDGKTLAVTNTLTFTGTDASSVAFGAGGTVAYTATNVGSFNGATGAVTGVASFNGLTGAVTGLTSGGPLGTPSSGTLTNCTGFPTLNQNTTGSAATLTIPRSINGVSFDGSANVTVTAAAGTLTGVTLNSTVLASSLTSVGTLLNLTVTNEISGDINGSAASSTTAERLATARSINGVSFDGSGNVTVTAAANTLTGTTLASNVVGSSLTSVGTISSGTWQGTTIGSAYVTTLNQNTTGSAAKLTTPVNINGVSFDGSANVTVTAAAGTLTGVTLNSTVLASSLTSVGTLGSLSITGDLTVGGTFTVNGTVTTINSTTLTVDDKNIELGSVGSPTDITAADGGISLKGTTDKTLKWLNSGAFAWTSSENFDLVSTKAYYIAGASVLNATTLGSLVVNSSLTSVGTLTSLTVSGTLEAGLIDGGTF